MNMRRTSNSTTAPLVAFWTNIRHWVSTKVMLSSVVSISIPRNNMVQKFFFLSIVINIEAAPVPTRSKLVRVSEILYL